MPSTPIHATSRIKKVAPSSWSQLYARLLVCFLIVWAQTAAAADEEDESDPTTVKSKWIDIYAPPVSPGTPLADWQVAGLRSVLNHSDSEVCNEGIQLLNELLAVGYDGTPLAQDIKLLLQSPAFNGSKHLLQYPAMDISRRSPELQDVIISQLADGSMPLSSKDLSFIEQSGSKSLPLVEQLLANLLSSRLMQFFDAQAYNLANTLNALAKQSPAIQALIEKQASSATNDEERLKLDVFIGCNQARARAACRQLLNSTNFRVKFYAAQWIGREGIPVLAERLMSDSLVNENIPIENPLFSAVEPYADDMFPALAIAMKYPEPLKRNRFIIASNITNLANRISTQNSVGVALSNTHLLRQLNPASAFEILLMTKIILNEDVSKEVQTLWDSGSKSQDETASRELFLLGQMGHLAGPIVPSLLAHLKKTKAPRPEVIELAGKIASDSPGIAHLLLPHLTSADIKSAQAAFAALGEIGTKAIDILPQLLALSQSDQEYLSITRFTITQLGSTAATHLVKQLSSGTSGEQCHALNILAGRSLAEFLFTSKKLHHPHFDNKDITTDIGRRRFQFTKAIAPALPELTRILLSNDDRSWKAARAIRSLNESAAPCLPDLLEMLNSDHPAKSKINALSALENIKMESDKLTHALAKLLDSQDADMLNSVIKIIDQMDAPPTPILRKVAHLLNHSRVPLAQDRILHIMSKTKDPDHLATDALVRWTTTNPPDDLQNYYNMLIAALRATRSSGASLAPVLVTASLRHSDNKFLIDGVPGDDPSALALYLGAILQRNEQHSPAVRLTAYHRFVDSAPSAFTLNFLGSTYEEAARANAWLIYQAGGDPNLLWLQKTLQHSRKANNELISTTSQEDAIEHLQFLRTILPKVARSPQFAQFFPSQHNMLLRTLENEALRLADSLPASPESLHLLRDLAPAVESQGTRALVLQKVATMRSQLSTRETLKTLLVTVGPVLLYLLSLLTIYLWRPAWLVPLAVSTGFPGALLLLRHLASSRRALDAWLWPQMARVQSRFKRRKDVAPHLTYVDRPVAVHQADDREIHTLNSTLDTATLCRARLGPRSRTIGQIVGIGGTGKSALVAQLGLNFLAPAETDEEGKTRHPILPLLAFQVGTQEVTSRLEQACKELLPEGPIPTWLVRRLLSTGRAIPIFDAVSEMRTDEFTNLNNWLEAENCRAPLCLLTTRQPFPYHRRRSLELRPILVGRNQVNAFTLGYLKQCNNTESLSHF